MKEGFWIRRATGQRWKVHEHSDFAKSQAGADAMGLPQDVRDYIAQFTNDYSGPNRERIVLAVMKAGFIRLRGHGAYWTFEFTGQFEASLSTILDAVEDLAGPATVVVIHDLEANLGGSFHYDSLRDWVRAHDLGSVRDRLQPLVYNPMKEL